MRSKLALTAATFVTLSASLVGCGEDTPAVCGSADQLRSSVQKLKDIDLTQDNGLDEFKSQLETVDGDVDQLTNDAKKEFSSQVDAVESTFETLGTSIQAAVADPSRDTVAAAVTAFSAFTDDVDTLIKDVKATC